MRGRSLLPWFLNGWVIGGALIFGLILAAATAGVVLSTRPGPSPSGETTAIVNIIRAPTATPIPPTLPPTPSPTPETPVPPAPEPGEIALETTVQITGTGGDGLRLRTEPGLKSEVRLLGGEAEVFMVKDGPQEADGFTWWYLVGLYDSGRRGWAVANYLAVVQPP